MVNKVKTATNIITTKHYKLFFNAQHLLLQLKTEERCFFDFLCEHLDNENTIYIDSKLAEKFINHVHNITSGKNKIASRTVKNYLEHLVEINLIIKCTSEKYKSIYMIHPKYAFKDALKKRTHILKQIKNNPDNKWGINKNVLPDIMINR